MKHNSSGRVYTLTDPKCTHQQIQSVHTNRSNVYTLTNPKCTHLSTLLTCTRVVFRVHAHTGVVVLAEPGAPHRLAGHTSGSAVSTAEVVPAVVGVGVEEGWGVGACLRGLGALVE